MVGVYYDANYGIGYEVEADKALMSEIDPTWEVWGMYDSLLKLCTDKSISVIQWGCCYSGIFSYAFVLHKPFENGVDLTGPLEALKAFIEEKGFKTTHDKPELVGGVFAC